MPLFANVFVLQRLSPLVEPVKSSFKERSLSGISVGNFLHHFAGHSCHDVQPRSAYLSEWPFTLFVWFLSSLTLSVFSYLFSFLLSLMPFLSPYLSRQPGPYLSACCLVTSCVSWPLAIPQSSSCQLLYPFLPPSSPRSFCMLSEPSTSFSNALSLVASPHSSVPLPSWNSLGFYAIFIFNFSKFGFTLLVFMFESVFLLQSTFPLFYITFLIFPLFDSVPIM